MTAVVDRRAPVPARRKKARGERLVPMVQLGLAMAVAILVLPSALRPPQDQPTSSGAFSPDAPPDPKQQSVFSSFNVSNSGTPAGEEAPPPPPGTPPTTVPAPPPPPPPVTVPRACPYGFGNPPRQVESVYAPPCAPVFKGDNGGATAFGVTATEIRVCFHMGLTGAGSNGPVQSPPLPGATAVNRTYGVLQQYFNSRLQLYGRQLRFFYSAGDGSKTGDESQRARSQQCKHTFQTFAAIQETEPSAMDELARLGILAFTLAQTPEGWFAAHDPYLWSFTPTADRTTQMGAEYACKKLVGKPPIYTDEDPTIPISHSKPRTWGVIVYSVPAYDNQAPKIKKAYEACGAKVVATVDYNLSGSEAGTTGLATALTQIKAAGATTIAYYGDLISAAVFTQAATQNNYYPEWYIPGFGGTDTGHIAQLYDQEQWKHAFGFSFYEITQPDNETECYKAYHEIDPDNNPDANMCIYMWGDMIQLFGAMQQAGPNLTVQTLKQAFLKQPVLKPTVPYNMAGGYSPTDHTFPDYAAEIWWDQTAVASDGSKGSYRWTNGGKRYTYGQWTTDPPTELFKSGITLAPAARAG